MYTLIRVRRIGETAFQWTGHIYDISLNGARFELDQPVDPGAEVEIRAMLPGREVINFHAIGRIVRLHTETDEPGPVRMAMTFNHFPRRLDRQNLDAYLKQIGKMAA